MPDLYDDDDVDVDEAELEQQQPQSRVVTLSRSDIKALEKKAKAAAENLARAEKAERALAFAQAGLDLSDPKTGYFVRGYEGDVSADAIRKAATEAGFLSPAGEQPPAPPSEQDQADARALTAMTQATGGGQLPPAQNHLQGMQTALDAGGTDALAEYMLQHGLPVSTVQ